jgi:hypothetical protein
MIQTEIDNLLNLINESGLKANRKKFAFDMVGKIVFKFNLLENKYQKRINQDHKIQNDFIDYFDRAKTILFILGINDLELFSFKYHFTNWIKTHIGETVKDFTFNSMIDLCYFLQMYEASYDGQLPKDMNELRRFILEPLKITEETFELEYQKALKEFAKTKQLSEILRCGWFKNLNGKIIKA